MMPATVRSHHRHMHKPLQAIGEGAAARPITRSA